MNTENSAIPDTASVSVETMELTTPGQPPVQVIVPSKPPILEPVVVADSSVTSPIDNTDDDSVGDGDSTMDSEVGANDPIVNTSTDALANYANLAIIGVVMVGAVYGIYMLLKYYIR